MRFRLAVAFLLLTICANAGVIFYGGDTSTGAVWNRPVANGTLPPTPPASGVGTAVRYHVQTFEVDTAGLYSIQSASTLPPGWDNYTFLYSGSFVALNPFANVIIGNDDNPTVGLSGFAVNLAVGTEYFLVTTGFGNTDMGQFTNTISGPGSITLTPEPSALLMLGGGLAAVGLLRRRRSA